MSFIDVVMMSLLKARHIGSLRGIWVFPLTMIIYATQPIMFYFGLAYESMGIFNVLWNAISTMLVAIAGVYLFGETLSTYNCIGIAMCISGIILIGL